MDIRLISLNARFSHSCLALFYLRNELEARLDDVNVEICHFTINDNYYELLLRIGHGEPDYLFFSTLIWNSDLVERLINDIGMMFPETSLVVGGPQATVVAANCSGISLTVVEGQIEAVSPRFYEDLFHKRLAEKYVCNNPFFQKSGISFPYREKDFKTHLANRQIYYESSRGCPFCCAYCLSGNEKGVFHKSVEEVIEEVDFMLEYNPKVIRFIDRTFNDNEKRALAIWHYLAEKECDTLFHFEVVSDRFSEQTLDFLATVPPNRFQFETGIQSTNRQTLQEIRRVVDTEKAAKVIRRIASAKNIHIHVDLILGLPFEDGKSYAKSFRDVFFMAPHYIQMGLLKLLPNTRLQQLSSSYGYQASKVPPYSIFCSSWMDRETMEHYYWLGECVECFLNNRYFVSLWDYLRDGREDIFLFFSDLLQLCLAKGFFQLSATHEMMGRLLVELIGSRPDKDVILELLKFDWYRCGHRFRPRFLEQTSTMKPALLKKKLYAKLPEEIAGVYQQREKNDFFKRMIFVEFNGARLPKICDRNIFGKDVIICFDSQREKSVWMLCKYSILQSKYVFAVKEKD